MAYFNAVCIARALISVQYFGCDYLQIVAPFEFRLPSSVIIHTPSECDLC